MTERGQMANLRALIQGAQDAYTLPGELLDAWAVSERVRALSVTVPARLSDDDAAAGLVAAVAAGEQPDLVKLGEELSRGETKTEAYRHAQRVLTAAVGEADRRAVSIASDVVETVIRDHLRPALMDVHDKAREAAAALDGYGDLDPVRLVNAPAKARAAFAELPVLVARRRLIFAARRSANRIGNRQPEHDATELFVEFAAPFALAADFNRNGLKSVAPQDPVAYLLWVSSDAAAAGRPWMPTIKEMDEAWWDQFGEGVEMRRRAASDARAIAAMFPDC